jgi:hypothetical protein
MAKLGYTWYPKDWGNSESVFEMTLSERGLYRELIDLAMLNNNETEIKHDVWSRKYAISVDELKLILDKLVALNVIKINGVHLFIPSCEPRLNLSRGGKASKPNETSLKNLSKPTSEPISKPTSEQREREIEIESKKKVKENNIVERKLKFSSSLQPFLNKYGKDLLNNFYKYWTEENKSGTKFKQELEQTWNLERRLETWSANELKFAGAQNKPAEVKTTSLSFATTKK